MTPERRFRFSLPSILSRTFFFELTANDHGVLSLDFAWTEGRPAKSVCDRKSEGLPDDYLFLKERLALYFRGRAVSFTDILLVLDPMTAFDRSVLSQTREIPWGSSVSYQELAKRVGLCSGARAVGGSMKRNPFPLLVPCHRVIRRDGTAGGYSKGLDCKRALLDLEGIPYEA